MTHSITHAKEGSAQNALELGSLLAGMTFLALIFVVADSGGWLDLLGWSKTPGFTLLVGLLVLEVALFSLGRPIGKIAVVAALFGVSLFLDQVVDVVRQVADISALPTSIWLLVALSPPLVGGYFVYRMQVPVALRGAFALLGGYIQAVHIYNAFHPAQYMGLFGGGWTS